MFRINLLLYLIMSLFVISCGDTGQEEVRSDIVQNKYEERLKLMRQLDNDSLNILADKYTSLLESENPGDSAKAFFYSQLGVVFYQHSMFSPAEKYFGKAQHSFSKIGDSTSRTNMLMNRAAMFDIEGQYEKAVAMYLEVIEFYKSTNDSLQLGSGFSNLGVAYEEMEQADKSLEYHKKALEIRLLIHDTLNIAYSYNNIGVVFTELLKEPDSALYYYAKADEIFKSTNALYQSATVSANLGHIYLDKNNFKKAKNNFDFAIVTLRIENYAERSINTNPWNWELEIDNVTYSHSSKTYSDEINCTVAEIGTGGKKETEPAQISQDPAG